MKKIRDERLIIRNLKNIRIAFVVENIMIVLILIWQAFKQHIDVLTPNNPFFAVIIFSALTLNILSINITAPTEDKPKVSLKKLVIHFLAIMVLASLIFLALFSGKHPIISLIAGTAIACVLLGMELYSNRFRE